MISYVFDPPAQPTTPVDGGGAFPVRRIWCVGRNYAAHAREMGADDREPPFFFSKPADAVTPTGAAIPYPPDTAQLEFEVELVLAVGRGGADIPAEHALDHLYGYAVGIDLTRRDRQAELKSKGHPWERAKAFDRSAPTGDLVPAARGPAPDAAIRLSVDGEARQDGRLSHMTWSPAEVVAALSRTVELRPGDLIFTGTPEGVGPVVRGQTLRAEVEGLPVLTVSFT